MNPTNQQPPENLPVFDESSALHPDDIMTVAAPFAAGMIDGPDPSEARNHETEIAGLQALIEGYQVQAEVIPVGEAGYVVRFARAENQKPETELTAYSPIVAFDADDTLFAYTQTKEPRLQKYSELTGSLLESELSPELSERIMTIADAFSRWEDNGGQMYHISAHKSALGWMTSQLNGVKPDKLTEKIEDMTVLLEQTKQGQEVDVPFRITDHKFMVTDSARIADVDAVFEPMIIPDRYHDTISVATSLTAEGVRTVIFTYGEPEFQLEKVLALQKERVQDGSTWPYTDVLLTKRPKGEFLEELAAAGSRDERLKMDFFADEPHVLVLVDDDPKQLTDFMSRSETVSAQSGVQLSSVRSTRPKTKAENLSWSADPYENSGDYANNRVLRADSDIAERFDIDSVVYGILHTSIGELIKTGASTEAKKILESQYYRFGTLEANRVYLNGGFDSKP